jgi:hypothetical protein
VGRLTAEAAEQLATELRPRCEAPIVFLFVGHAWGKEMSMHVATLQPEGRRFPWKEFKQLVASYPDDGPGEQWQPNVPPTN